MKIILLFLVGICLLSACSDSFEEVYGGNWQVVWEGNYDGSSDIFVSDEGAVTGTLIFDNFWGGSIVNTVEGQVEDDGEIQGTISMDGDLIGTFTGHLHNDGAGSGTYETTVPTSGTWAAVKK